VYPALAVLQALRSRQPDVEVTWVGGAGGMEAELVTRAGVPFRSVPAAGVHGVGLRRLPGNAWALARGWRAARWLLRELRPDVLFFTGGYVAVPVALAGRRLPTLLYTPDIEPGLALKTLTRFADHVAVTAEESRRFYPGRLPVTVTGYPVRADLTAWTRAEARAALGLESDRPVLLVFGGSKGARSINRALLAALEPLLDEVEVVHISGKLDWPEVEQTAARLDATRAARYHPFPYLHERMGAALRAADLAVSRAGASTLGEFPAFGLPAVLVPYPYAWRYQRVNAEYLVSQGAAVLLPDEELPARLLPLVRDLLRDSGRRERMAQAMQRLARPQAAAQIADLLIGMASGAERAN